MIDAHDGRSSDVAEQVEAGIRAGGPHANVDARTTRPLVTAVISPSAPGENVPPRRARPLLALVDELEKFAASPMVPWGFPQVDRCAPLPVGSVATVIGATGRGKSAFLLQIATRHARTIGPVLVVSAELAGSMVAARIVGQGTGASWFEVLRGKVRREDLVAALDIPALRILDDVGPTVLTDIEAELSAYAFEYPSQPSLVVVDYLQLLPSSENAGRKELRERVSDNMKALRTLAVRHSAVVIVIAKASRSGATGLRRAERVGVDTTEAGAETNAIEYESTVVLALGAMEPVDAADPDGPQIVDLSIAKSRLGASDKVVPMRFEGAAGRFAEHGVVVSAAERRKGLASRGRSSKIDQLVNTLPSVVGGMHAPVSATEIAKGLGRKADVCAALKQCVAAGTISRVRLAGKARKDAPYATPTQVKALGLDELPREGGPDGR